MTVLPRILLVSEVPFSKNGMGANRTLFNLFDSYPRERLLLFVPENSLKPYPTDPPFNDRVVSFPGNYLPLIYNRIGKLINPLITGVNLQILDLLPIFKLKALEEFAPEIVLICPIGSWCLLMGEKLTRYFQCPSLVYFMDDWLDSTHYWWASSNVQKVAYKLLKKSAGWLMISEYLEAEFKERYKLQPQRSLIVHNPVDFSGKETSSIPTQLPPQNKSKFRIAYAGSIWQMHYDAFFAVAKAIFELRDEGQEIELILYTDQGFWNYHKNELEKLQVVYGSFIPYRELDSHLKQADLLLVATSFLPDNSNMVRYSVLTKLTDYMATGRTILSCGPDYSACNKFIKKWNCGLVCETNKVEEIKDFLLKTMKEPPPLRILSQTAFEVVKNNFEKREVSTKLYNFLQSIAKAS